MKTCDNLKPYIMEELGQADRVRFEAHLTECSDCRQAMAVDDVLAKALTGIPRVNTPHGFTRLVMQGIAEQRNSRAAWAVYGAALVVLAFATTLLAGGSLEPLVEQAGVVMRSAADMGASLFTAIRNISGSLYSYLSFGRLTPLVLTGAFMGLGFMFIRSILAFSVVRKR